MIIIIIRHRTDTIQVNPAFLSVHCRMRDILPHTFPEKNSIFPDTSFSVLAGI